MRELFYDFHIHSCLSPCGDSDMTPNSIAGMAKLNGLDIAALTDHNTCKNCPAFFEACRRYGVVPVAGVELTTAEDIHLVCLFETLEDAMAFDADLQHRRVLVKNKPDFMGEQLIVDAEDEIIGTEENLLPNATDLTIEEAFDFAARHGAVVYPAHVDRPSNGVVSVLGTFPSKPDFRFAEFNNRDMLLGYRMLYPEIKKTATLVGSDAHRLHEISEAENSLFLNVEGDGEDEIRAALFDWLRGRGAR